LAEALPVDQVAICLRAGKSATAMLRVGDVDVGAARVDVELETLWMRAQCNLGDFAVRAGIDQRQRSAAVADDNLPMRPIDAHIVSVTAEIDPATLDVIGALINPHRAITAIGDIERVGGPQVTDALRLFQACQALHNLALLDVDNADRVIAELGHKQPLPIGICRHVIDAAANVAERNSRLQL